MVCKTAIENSTHAHTFFSEKNNKNQKKKQKKTKTFDRKLMHEKSQEYPTTPFREQPLLAVCFHWHATVSQSQKTDLRTCFTLRAVLI